MNGCCDAMVREEKGTLNAVDYGCFDSNLFRVSSSITDFKRQVGWCAGNFKLAVLPPIFRLRKILEVAFCFL